MAGGWGNCSRSESGDFLGHRRFPFGEVAARLAACDSRAGTPYLPCIHFHCKYRWLGGWANWATQMGQGGMRQEMSRDSGLELYLVTWPSIPRQRAIVGNFGQHPLLESGTRGRA